MAKVTAKAPKNSSETSLVPSRIDGYVPFGNFETLDKILKSKRFYPTYITGLSGNGKTVMVEELCAVNNREFIRVNITGETDEDDLLGGFRLVDGETVWHDGPVVQAMERGAILLLDEVDLGSIKLMCLQPVLEGRAIFLKKIKRVVEPAPGFQIVATANTKGRGNEDGLFIGTNVMNEAFLERFSVTLEQSYPPSEIEQEILNKVFAKNKIKKEDYEDFVVNLVDWAGVTRATYEDVGDGDIISTRRLVHICQAYCIFENKIDSINYCINRFSEETKKNFLNLYTNIDAKANGDDADEDIDDFINDNNDTDPPF